MRQRAQAPGKLAQQGAALRRDQFGGGGRRRRAQVGSEIGDGEVGFVADARRSPAAALARIARATTSSLKAHRSSSEPPPRTSSSTSTSARCATVASIAAIRAPASAPCTGTGYTTISRYGARRRSVVSTSRSAAACSEVTTPTRRGSGGSGRLRRGVEQSLGRQALAQAQELLPQPPGAEAAHRLDAQLKLAARFVEADGGQHLDLVAVARREIDLHVAAAEHHAAHLRRPRP